jgi:chaperonin GroES
VAEAPQLPIRMLHDRLLVEPDKEGGERKSSAGIVIPATAAVGRRLAWGEVVAAGPHVRQVTLGDKILFDPEDRAEVELEGNAYVLLRERDVHAISESAGDEATGLYL